ncbi:glycosyltransferase family 2 protein [Frisingicoccus sp.]|uniref:glycosyltransferase family 2 protein n=1 Tax=Frisingicoccus sp. TaxID=1918627 RepID=UPI003AB4A820
MKDILVTGCIVTYNNAHCVGECIESILRETKREDFQLYVSDNYSQDQTVDMIKSRFPGVKVLINSHNGGFGYGHNRMLKIIHSKYHLVINPDIIFEEDIIEKLVNYMEMHPEVGMITPKILNRDGTEQFLPKKDPSFRYVVMSKFKPFNHYRDEYTRKNEVFEKPTEIDSCTGCFFLIRTELFKKLNGFDRHFFMYYEDADLSRRARKYQKLIFYPEGYVYHDWKRDNVRSLRGILIFLKSMIVYFKKWKWRF